MDLLRWSIEDQVEAALLDADGEMAGIHPVGLPELQTGPHVGVIQVPVKALGGHSHAMREGNEGNSCTREHFP